MAGQLTLRPSAHLACEVLRAVIDQPLTLRLSTDPDQPVEPTRNYSPILLADWQVDEEATTPTASIGSVTFTFGGATDKPIVAAYITAGNGPPLWEMERLPGALYEVPLQGGELEVPGVTITIPLAG
jgi:hypothetical protein